MSWSKLNIEGEVDRFLECSLNSIGRDTPLFSIPNVLDCHNHILEEKVDFGNNVLSSRKEDMSCRVSNFDATITAAKAAL